MDGHQGAGWLLRRRAQIADAVCMTTVGCPCCAGDVWVRDMLVPASGPSGERRLTRGSALDDLRWTCVGCGYQAKSDGLLSWRLDGLPVCHEEPIAAEAR